MVVGDDLEAYGCVVGGEAGRNADGRVATEIERPCQSNIHAFARAGVTVSLVGSRRCNQHVGDSEQPCQLMGVEGAQQIGTSTMPGWVHPERLPGGGRIFKDQVVRNPLEQAAGSEAVGGVSGGPCDQWIYVGVAKSRRRTGQRLGRRAPARALLEMELVPRVRR